MRALVVSSLLIARRLLRDRHARRPPSLPNSHRRWRTRTAVLIDGDGSLALIHTGLIQLDESRILDPLKSSNSTVSECMVRPPYPSLNWRQDSTTINSFSWISKWHIRTETIPQLEREIESAQTPGAISDPTQLVHLKTALRRAKSFDPRTNKATLKGGLNLSDKRARLPTSDGDTIDQHPAIGFGVVQSNNDKIGDPLRLIPDGAWDPLSGSVDAASEQWNDPRSKDTDSFLLSVDGGGSGHTFTIEISMENEGTKKAVEDFDHQQGAEVRLTTKQRSSARQVNGLFRSWSPLLIAWHLSC